MTLADELRAVANAAMLDYNVDTALLNTMRTKLREAADRLDAACEEVSNYAGWYEDAPEDSWRFERDIRTVLGMPQYERED